MRVRIQVIIESEAIETPVVQEVATLERGPLQPEGLGLTLAEAKDLLRAWSCWPRSCPWARN
jgi:hypothetical protein